MHRTGETKVPNHPKPFIGRNKEIMGCGLLPVEVPVPNHPKLPYRGLEMPPPATDHCCSRVPNHLKTLYRDRKIHCQ